MPTALVQEGQTSGGESEVMPGAPTSPPTSSQAAGPAPAASAAPAKTGTAADASVRTWHAGPAPDPLAARPPRTTALLRPGATFRGTQAADSRDHDVQVELKFVDLKAAYLCGYLHISKLTTMLPTLTTFFEGEIISDRNSFTTQHADWGATPESDREHWRRFRAATRGARDGGPHMSERYARAGYDRENYIFMRWKERFLEPDSRVTEVQGASYSGFYYICLDQAQARITGYYYQKGQGPRDQFQTIRLQYVEESQRPNFTFC